MDNVLFDYINHPENKFEGIKGVLSRIHVKARKILLSARNRISWMRHLYYGCQWHLKNRQKRQDPDQGKKEKQGERYKDEEDGK